VVPGSSTLCVLDRISSQSSSMTLAAAFLDALSFSVREVAKMPETSALPDANKLTVLSVADD
jgi:hypothetical protein